MTTTLQIPPMPKAKDFLDEKGNARQDAFKAALDAWKAVSLELIEADKSNKFWCG